ncbi:white collar 2 type of transcription factor [Taxawa tesnikishii (nom. ined.)]|nr:white collar 2 type of transcription factor [Dothideales sp. JES 119]
MSDLLVDQGSNLMSGYDANFLPMDLDLDPRLADPQSYNNPMGSASNAPQDSSNSFADGSSNTNMSGVGAGPPPTGFGAAPPANSSTLTEFTKRRNWSQRVIEEIRDFLHILTPDGRLLYVSPSCKNITGYDPQSLIGKFIGEYVHPDDSGIFMPSPYGGMNQGNNNNALTPPSGRFCRGFFMLARPYPTKSSALLDSFLEHKIENERLRKRIEELKREEAEEESEATRQLQAQSAALSERAGFAGSETTGDGTAGRTPNYQGMPPPAKPTVSNIALTRQNLDSVLSQQRPDSIADKMSRYEGSNHMESIEMMTGLRYRDGERSHGISTGDTSPALIRGDAGIAILVDRDREGSKEKKKKLKIADEYVCADCGTLDSPEWRKGPKGPKTLCNACGLRWAKKEKKRQGLESNPTPAAAGQGGAGATNNQDGLTASGQPPGLKHQSSSSSSNNG